ncbi:MAG TPA: FxsA family protein [Nocardioidaceae bacterium]|jgi:UPF0716 protein FxsA
MPLILFILFIGVPILEIYVIIQVGQVIGALPTLVLLIVESILGAWLIKHEGRRAWDALNEAIRTGQMPGRQLADAALVLVGGTLLLTPGFVTDVFGFFFVLPFTRAIARRIFGFLIARGVLRRFGPTVRVYRHFGDPGTSYRDDRDRGRPPQPAPHDGDVHQIYRPEE